MIVTLRISDGPDGVNISSDAPVPDVLGDSPCEMSRLVAAFMIYAAEKILVNSPVRSVTFE